VEEEHDGRKHQRQPTGGAHARGRRALDGVGDVDRHVLAGDGEQHRLELLQHHRTTPVLAAERDQQARRHGEQRNDREHGEERQRAGANQQLVADDAPADEQGEARRIEPQQLAPRQRIPVTEPELLLTLVDALAEPLDLAIGLGLRELVTNLGGGGLTGFVLEHEGMAGVFGARFAAPCASATP